MGHEEDSVREKQDGFAAHAKQSPGAERPPVGVSGRPAYSSALQHKRWSDTLSTAEQARYEERTRRLAEGGGNREDNSGLVHYTRFRLGASERYGIPFSNIKEVMYASGLVSVPSTPDFIAGVISRGGEILTILDLGAFFRTERVEPGEDARIIIIEGAGLTVGLLVDEVDGNNFYDPAQLSLPLPSEGVSDMRYVKGIHKGNVTILDPEALLSDQAIRVG